MPCVQKDANDTRTRRQRNTNENVGLKQASKKKTTHNITNNNNEGVLEKEETRNEGQQQQKNTTSPRNISFHIAELFAMYGSLGALG